MVPAEADPIPEDPPARPSLLGDILADIADLRANINVTDAIQADIDALQPTPAVNVTDAIQDDIDALQPTPAALAPEGEAGHPEPDHVGAASTSTSEQYIAWVRGHDGGFVHPGLYEARFPLPGSHGRRRMMDGHFPAGRSALYRESQRKMSGEIDSLVTPAARRRRRRRRRHGWRRVLRAARGRRAHLSGPPGGRLSAISVFLYKSVLYGAFVWARRALKRQKRRFPARAVRIPLAACARPLSASDAAVDTAAGVGMLAGSLVRRIPGVGALWRSYAAAARKAAPPAVLAEGSAAGRASGGARGLRRRRPGARVPGGVLGGPRGEGGRARAPGAAAGRMPPTAAQRGRARPAVAAPPRSCSSHRTGASYLSAPG